LLNTVGVTGFDLLTQALLDLLSGKRTADEPRDRWIAPERTRERQIVLRPKTETEAIAYHKVAVRHYVLFWGPVANTVFGAIVFRRTISEAPGMMKSRNSPTRS